MPVSRALGEAKLTDRLTAIAEDFEALARLLADQEQLALSDTDSGSEIVKRLRAARAKVLQALETLRQYKSRS